MIDLKSMTVEELMKKVDLFSKDSFDELARRLEEARQRSEAHDAEVAAKALEEVAKGGWGTGVMRGWAWMYVKY